MGMMTWGFGCLALLSCGEGDGCLKQERMVKLANAVLVTSKTLGIMLVGCDCGLL